jgi:hypothetical protein
VTIRDGRYQAPQAAGYSAEIKASSPVRFAYPTGDAWNWHEPHFEGIEMTT